METWFIPLFCKYIKKKLKLTSKGLSESCNYALAKDSDQSNGCIFWTKFQKEYLWPTPEKSKQLPQSLEYKEVSAWIYNLAVKLGIV